MLGLELKINEIKIDSVHFRVQAVDRNAPVTLWEEVFLLIIIFLFFFLFLLFFFSSSFFLFLFLLLPIVASLYPHRTREP